MLLPEYYDEANRTKCEKLVKLVSASVPMMFSLQAEIAAGVYSDNIKAVLDALKQNATGLMSVLEKSTKEYHVSMNWSVVIETCENVTLELVRIICSELREVSVVVLAELHQVLCIKTSC